MSQPLPLKRGLPPSGPRAGQTPTGPRSSQRRATRHIPVPNVTRAPSRPSSIRGENRYLSYQPNGDTDTYRSKYNLGPPSPRSDRYRDFSSHPDLNSNLYHRDDERKPKSDFRTRRYEKERQYAHNSSKRARRGYDRFSRVASERIFLRTNREPTPQLMSGFNAESENTVKFLPLEDLSDSEEADMDLSGNEDICSEEKKPCSTSISPKISDPFGLEPDDPSIVTISNVLQGSETGRISTASFTNDQDQNKYSSKVAAKENEVRPRWSNPDPYTALPPPDESQRKKKDVVKLIRKARIASGSKNKLEASTDDFISFNFEENHLADSPRPLTGYYSPKKVYRANSDKKDSSLFPKNYSRSASPLSSDSDEAIKTRGKSRQRRPTKKLTANDFISDPNLGTRKRTVRDEIIRPPVNIEKGIRSRPDGSILKEWLALDGISETPWLIDHSRIRNIYRLLHEEVLDFYHYVKPRSFEQSIRDNLIEDLRCRVRNYSRQAEIFSFGSFPAGLYLPTADLDLVMVSDHFMQGGRPLFGYNAGQVHKFARFLEEEQVIFQGSKECITKAKVPLVKYIDKLTGLKVDISFENTTGLAANKTFQAWKEMFPAMPIIVTLIKQFLSMRGLNEPVNGGIGGFSVTCLVVSLLQHMPQVRDGSMIPEHHLGEVLLEFFDLYGNRFNTMKNAISIDPPSYINKFELNQTYGRQVDKFCIIDPNNPDNDIAGGSSNSLAIKRAFQDAYNILRLRMCEVQRNLDRSNRRPHSILGCVIGGNYSSFKLQREHLAYIYEKNISL